MLETSRCCGIWTLRCNIQQEPSLVDGRGHACRTAAMNASAGQQQPPEALHSGKRQGGWPQHGQEGQPEPADSLRGRLCIATRLWRRLPVANWHPARESLIHVMPCATHRNAHPNSVYLHSSHQFWDLSEELAPCSTQDLHTPKLQCCACANAGVLAAKFGATGMPRAAGRADLSMGMEA